MSKHARDRRPYIRPVTKLELSETNIKFRWIAIGVLLSVAVVAIGYGFFLALNKEPGWQQVSTVSDTVNCSNDFVLMYEFGAGDTNATAEAKKLETLYTDLTEEAYRLFHSEAEGTDNLYHINAHVNETVTVAPALYRSLEQIVRSGSRYPFLRPVQDLYAPVFLAEDDMEAAIYDPMKIPELAEEAAFLAEYCSDPSMVSLEVFGQNQVRLNVSASYLAVAEEYGIAVFLDFGWMTNAFIADFMADALEAEGFTRGYLASYDGFTRNLDTRGTEFTVNLFDRQDNDVRMPGNFCYSGPMSLVSFRDYPLSDREKWHYHAYGDGSITTAYLDPEDGLSKSSVSDIMTYSRSAGCAWIALRTAPVFIAESFDAQALECLVQEGIESVRCFGNSVICTQDPAPVRISDGIYDLIISNTK